MGLDINFFTVKASNRKKYDKEYKEWDEKEPKFYFVDTGERKPYENWTEEEHKVYDEWKTQRPDADEVFEECGYFRKVNFLLPFFNYAENCDDLVIDKNDIYTLKKFCNEILDAYEGKTDDDEETWEGLAEDLLPTESGFFFGSTDYDEGYIEDVREVRDWCENLIESEWFDDDEYELIMNCWW